VSDTTRSDSAVSVPSDRAPGAAYRERHQILDQHLLLATEAAADPAGQHPHLVQGQLEQLRQGPPGQERGLRAGAQREPARVVEPADGAVRLQGRVLDPGRAERLLVHHGGAGEPGGDVAQLGVQLAHHVVGRPGDAVTGHLVAVHGGRAGPHRGFRVEDGRQDLVRDPQPPAPLLGGGLGLRDHGGDPLADVPDHVVEHPGVGGVLGGVLVAGGGEVPRRRVGVGQHRQHPRHGQRRGGVDGGDPGVRVRRAQHLEVQQAGDVDIEGVPRRTGDDLRAGGRAEAGADRLPGRGLLDGADAVDRVGDGAVSGAAAEVALERARQVGQLRLVQRGGRHDHPGGAEAALEALRVQEALLHRVQAGRRRQALDGGDLPALGAEGRIDAAVHRHAVDVHGAGAAVAGVAALLDAEAALLAQVRPQALPGAGRLVVVGPVDSYCHASSARISWANRPVRCRRQAGRPCTSST
jgi:hypothetical protein